MILESKLLFCPTLETYKLFFIPQIMICNLGLIHWPINYFLYYKEWFVIYANHKDQFYTYPFIVHALFLRKISSKHSFFFFYFLYHSLFVTIQIKKIQNNFFFFFFHFSIPLFHFFIPNILTFFFFICIN